MPTMRPDYPVVAILCSDVHLTLKPPVAREEEPNWLNAMERPWTEISHLAIEWEAPILCAGDIFDRWNSSAELINWALDILPDIYAIPGNHDLPYHNHALAHRSAYGALVRAGKIMQLTPEGTVIHQLKDGPNLHLYGFPFGSPIRPPVREDSNGLYIALIHEYIWIKGKSYPGAAKEGKLSNNEKAYKGYNVVAIGDNHQGFRRRTLDDVEVFNCGTLMRRKSNEIDYRPHVGLVYANGAVEPHYLDTNKDIITKVLRGEEIEVDPEIAKFVAEMAALGDSHTLDFLQIMKKAMKKAKVNPLVKKYILEALDG